MRSLIIAVAALALGAAYFPAPAHAKIFVENIAGSTSTGDRHVHDRLVEPHCARGKQACGHTCIAKGKVCHVH